MIAVERLPQDFPDANVCIVGLGFVGLTLAVVLGSVGFHVDGVEISEEVRTHLSGGRAHFHEPGLDNRLARLLSEGRLRISASIPVDTPATVFIVTVGTPLGDNGRVRLDMIERAAQSIRERLKPGDMVVLRSTVRLGVTRSVVMPVLDAAGVPYDIAFCPERTVEGQAMAELRLLPQVVGAFNVHARIRATRLFNFLTPTVVQVGSLEVAEMVKLMDNTYRDISFAFANELAQMCDAAGLNAVDVIKAGNLGYQRTNVPMPGPVGGPCLGKDPHILAEAMESFGFRPELTLTGRRIHEGLADWSAKIIRDAAKAMPGMPDDPVIAVMGLAFKGRPPTDDLRGTPAVAVLAALRQMFPCATFRGFDAMVTPEKIRQVFAIEPISTIQEAMLAANIVVIANNHPVFAPMPIESLADGMASPGIIYDFWNHFLADEMMLRPGVRYIGLGVPPAGLNG